jgi:branched-chain amino acid transport system permease protein
MTMDIFGVPHQAVLGQLMLGVINGAFYSLLSIGLAVIFGLLNVANFAHGAQYMLGAFITWMLLQYASVGYWAALLLTPMIAAAIGMALEKGLVSRLYAVDPVYGILLTFGVALVLQGVFRAQFGASGLAYGIPDELRGAWNIGFMVLPKYRAWAVLAALGAFALTWYAIERTSVGAKLRAATERPDLVEAFGTNVPLLKTAIYGAGTALAAFAGALAAPIYSVSPLMGAEVIIVVFAVVVIGGMGSLVGAVVTSFVLGAIEGMFKVFYPQFSSTVVFLSMIAVLLLRPAGLFGRASP